MGHSLEQNALKSADNPTAPLPYPEFEVIWRIQLTAASPRDAAFQAQQIQRDPFSTATVFEVNGKEIDLEVSNED